MDSTFFRIVLQGVVATIIFFVTSVFIYAIVAAIVLGILTVVVIFAGEASAYAIISHAKIIAMAIGVYVLITTTMLMNKTLHPVL